MKKETTCCFTGPRPHKLPLLTNTEQRGHLMGRIAREILRMAMRDGYDTFLCGMAQGADMLFAETLLHLREETTVPLHLVCVIPFFAQADAWPEDMQRQYENILFRAEQRIILKAHYSNGCLLSRNRFMVDHSSLLLAVYNERMGGGTGYTVDYAQKRKLRITQIDPISP